MTEPLLEDIDTGIPQYTRAQFLLSTDPYEFIYSFSNNKLKMKQMINLMSEQAKAVKVNNFASLFAEYQKSLKAKSGFGEENHTDFTGQPLDLECGSWTADDDGVSSIDRQGFEVMACNHPIMPARRLVNVDTGIEKIEIAFRKGKGWRRYIADKKTIASTNSIVQLADFGIAVNSENAKHLIRYFTDVEHLNYDKIEEVSSVGRLGWINDYGFSPYVEKLEFDGEISFKTYFESVKEHGDFDSWIKLVRESRKDNICARLILASSFASVLVSPCSALPFFVHLWGGTETGKTVGLMLAASVWANPEMGRYIHTFNSTSVAQELSASFVNSLPLIIDELQIVKDRKDFDNLIYQLSEGIGRSRGRREGGLQRVGTWSNCILTTGEMPIGGAYSGAGAINRIIEIDCQDIKLFSDPIKVADTVKKHYGFAGRLFVDMLSEPKNMEASKSLQKEIYKQLSYGESTEKQSLSASLILAADMLAEKWIFKDGIKLTVKDIEPYLSTKEQVSQSKRALQFLYDTISINWQRFEPHHNPKTQQNEYIGEVWGAKDEKFIYIIRSQFDKILQGEGFNPMAFLSWAKKSNLIVTPDSKNTKTKRINGNVVRCVWLKVDSNQENENFEEIENGGDLPFN